MSACELCLQEGKACRQFESHLWRQDRCRTCGHPKSNHSVPSQTTESGTENAAPFSMSGGVTTTLSSAASSSGNPPLAKANTSPSLPGLRLTPKKKEQQQQQQQQQQQPPQLPLTTSPGKGSNKIPSPPSRKLPPKPQPKQQPPKVQQLQLPEPEPVIQLQQKVTSPRLHRFFHKKKKKNVTSAPNSPTITDSNHHQNHSPTSSSKTKHNNATQQLLLPGNEPPLPTRPAKRKKEDTSGYSTLPSRMRVRTEPDVLCDQCSSKRKTDDFLTSMTRSSDGVLILHNPTWRFSDEPLATKQDRIPSLEEIVGEEQLRAHYGLLSEQLKNLQQNNDRLYSNMQTQAADYAKALESIEGEWQKKYALLKSESELALSTVTEESKQWRRNFEDQQKKNKELQEELEACKQDLAKFKGPSSIPVIPAATAPVSSLTSPRITTPLVLTPPTTPITQPTTPTMTITTTTPTTPVTQPTTSTTTTTTNATPTTPVALTSSTFISALPIPPISPQKTSPRNLAPAPPQPPPRTSRPSFSGGQRPDIAPVAQNQRLSSMVKNARRKMSNYEYRKSMSLKGGETRLAYELDKRACVVKEILTSERNYVKCLKILIEEYQKPLEVMFERKTDDASPLSQSSPSLRKATFPTLKKKDKDKEKEKDQLHLSRLEKEREVTIEDIKSVFYQLKVIYNFNSLLLQQLEERIEVPSWTPGTQLGDIFVDLGNYLKVYTSYISNYMDALAILKDCKRNRRFNAFLRKMEATHVGTNFHGYQLDMFLITPIQRIPRYICLLKELLKYTESSHADHPLLTKAISIIERAAMSNERSHERKINITTLVALERLFYNADSGEMISLVAPHRIFLYEGGLTMHKRFMMSLLTGTVRLGHNTVTKERHVLLFNDILLIAKRHHTNKDNNKENNNDAGDATDNIHKSSDSLTHARSLTISLSHTSTAAAPFALQDDDELEFKAQLYLKDLEASDWDGPISMVVHNNNNNNTDTNNNNGVAPKIERKGFRLEGAGQKSYFFEAPSESVQAKWLTELKHAIEAARKKALATVHNV